MSHWLSEWNMFCRLKHFMRSTLNNIYQFFCVVCVNQNLKITSLLWSLTGNKSHTVILAGEGADCSVCERTHLLLSHTQYRDPPGLHAELSTVIPLNCKAITDSNVIIKFANDTAVVGYHSCGIPNGKSYPFGQIWSFSIGQRMESCFFVCFSTFPYFDHTLWSFLLHCHWMWQ